MFDLNLIYENLLDNFNGGKDLVSGDRFKKTNVNYKVESEMKNFSRKFDCEQTLFKISFPIILKTFEDGLTEINQLFQDLHQQFIDTLKPREIIRIVFSHTSFQTPVNIPFMTKEDLTELNFLNYFEHIMQSFKTIAINKDNSFYISIIIAHLPRGQRKMTTLKKKQPKYTKKNRIKKKSKFFHSHQDYCDNNKGIITVLNNDNLCGIRAILIALAFEQNDPQKYLLTHKDSEILNTRVHNFLINSNLDKEYIEQYGLGLHDFEKIENYLQTYQLTIIHSDGKLNKEPIYIGKTSKKTKHHIYISFTGTHFNVIKSKPLQPLKCFFLH